VLPKDVASIGKYMLAEKEEVNALEVQDYFPHLIRNFPLFLPILV